MTNCKKNIVVLMLCLAGVVGMYAQETEQALLRQLNSAVKDSAKAYILNKLANDAYQKKKYVNAIQHAQESIDKLAATENDTLEADNQLIIARSLFNQDKAEKALPYYLRASSKFEKLNNYDCLVNVYRDIAAIYAVISAHEKALDYNIKAYQVIAENSQLTVNQIDINALIEDIGITAFNAKKYSQAVEYLEKLLKIYNDDEAPVDQVRTLHNLNLACKAGGDYKKALEYNYEMYDIISSTCDSLEMAAVMNNIGYDHVHNKAYGKAIEAFEKSLNIGRKTGLTQGEEAKLLVNMGVCYQNRGIYNSAIEKLQEALKIRKLLNDFFEMARIENIIALIYYHQGDLYNAGFFSRNSIESAKKSGDPQMLQLCYRTYSQILSEGNDYISALEYYKMHLNIRDSLLLEKRLEEKQQADQQFELEKSEKELRLNLADEEMKDLMLKKLRLEAEKKNKELELLRKQKELEQSEKERIMQSLALERERHEAAIMDQQMQVLEQEKRLQSLDLKRKEAEEKQRKKEIALLQSEKERQQLEIEKQKEAQKRTIWMASLSAIIALLILLGLITTRKKNAILAQQKKDIEKKNFDLEQKNEEITTQNEKIISQKELIEEKNKSITDSIVYAQRIQSAVLPSMDFIADKGHEYFVFFRPKDIVSGDFFWGVENNGRIVIAAADCTGHGVPGAFMSMLGTTFLNEINGKNSKKDAGQMLNELRENVINSLKQRGEEGEAKDGMDIALCVIEKENKLLQYAGANNPLYIINKGEFKIVKADRMPIGIHYDIEKPFTKNELKISPGDVFYIFSDGFADQFGGKLGKKFKYKNFQELLFRIHEYPMNEQKEILEKTFDEWKGDYEQIDDILIIGVKL